MSLQLPGGGAVRAGSTSLSIPFMIRSSTDNTGVTGVAAASITASYWRAGGSRTAITVTALASIAGAYVSGGWLQVDSTNLPGLYRFDAPDAAFAVGADWAVVGILVNSGAYLSTNFYALTYDNLIRTFTPATLAANSVTFDSGASASNSNYNDCVVQVISSDVAADIGAAAIVTSYVGATKVATLGLGWNRTPTGTSSAMTMVCYGGVAGTAAGMVGALTIVARSGNTLTFKYPNGDTATTRTETRTGGINPLTDLA